MGWGGAAAAAAEATLVVFPTPVLPLLRSAWVAHNPRHAPSFLSVLTLPFLFIVSEPGSGDGGSQTNTKRRMESS